MSKIEPGFSVESLENGIAAAKKNILVFEEAIDKERTTIKEYHAMIETIERKRREAVASVIEIPAER